MAAASLLKTTTSVAEPFNSLTDGAGGGTTSVSDFLTLQSLTNFAVMTGAIAAAWKALERLHAPLSAIWVPYAFAGAFGAVSILISLDGLKEGGKLGTGKLLAAVFIALINALVLASAVVGTDIAVATATP